jgi:hypothetical protein
MLQIVEVVTSQVLPPASDAVAVKVTVAPAEMEGVFGLNVMLTADPGVTVSRA